MVHDYNTRGKKQELVVKMDKDFKMKDTENYTLISINFLKNEILNRKEIVTKNLQNENEKLRQKFEQLERRCAKYESDHNALAQYDRQNNVIVSGIPDSVSADSSE